MGCCNKEPTERPLARWRYHGARTLLVLVHGAFLVLLAVGALFNRRYRRVLPFYRAYSRETLRSVGARERICVEGDGERGCAAD